MQQETMMVPLQPCAMMYQGMPEYHCNIQLTFYSCYSIECMTLMIPCSGLSERIECKMTSKEPFSDDIMTAVSSALQRLCSVTDTPINCNDSSSISSEGKPESNVS